MTTRRMWGRAAAPPDDGTIRRTDIEGKHGNLSLLLRLVFPYGGGGNMLLLYDSYSPTNGKQGKVRYATSIST